MAHSGCACHSSLPRHRFHSIRLQEIHHRARRTEDAVVKKSALAVVTPAIDALDEEVHQKPKHAKTEDTALDIYIQVRTGGPTLEDKNLALLTKGTSPGLVKGSSLADTNCRHASSVPISDATENLLTIIPASLDEACFQVPVPEGRESLGEKMRAILCASNAAALYCTPARRGGTVYWIAQTSLPVNERAVRATGVAGISGDAVLIENEEYGPLHLAIPSRQTIHSPCASLERKSFEFQSRDMQVEQKSLQDFEKRREEGIPSGKPSLQVECSHKRSLGEGLELSTIEGCVQTANCSHSEAGDPLVKKPRQTDDGGQLLNTEQVVRIESVCALEAEASERCANHSSPRQGLENIDKATKGSEQKVLSVQSIDVSGSEETHQPIVLLESLQALPIGRTLKDSSHQQGGSNLINVQILKSQFDSVTSEPSSIGCSYWTNEVESSSVDSLSVGELQTVFSYLTFSDLSTASAVCKLWRASIAEDEPLLKNLRIRRRMFQPANAPPSLNRSKFRSDAHPLPFVLLRAAELSNVPAMVLVAEEMDRQGNRTKALEWFKKAARKGDQASQYRIGEAFYRGDSDWPQDGEEAIIWLSRAAKFVNGDKRICGAAGLLLGYMHLDGEGIAAADNTEAVRWFRFAADMGNREAEKTVGWLWNTGQF